VTFWEEWIPAHKRLFKGPKRGLPRAVRFVLLELSMEARPTKGRLDLYPGSSTVDALHDLIGGNRQEIEAAVEAFAGDAFIIERTEKTHSLTIPKWEDWAGPKSGADRQAEWRKRGRESQGGDNVYFIRRPSDGRIKIGYTNNVRNRLNDLRGQHGERLEILAREPGGKSRESVLHNQFSEHRRRGEWFDAAPELLAYVDELNCSNGQGVTLMNEVTPTGQDSTEQEKTKQNRTEPTGAGAPDAAGSKGRRGTRLPATWSPTPGSYAKVLEKTGQTEAEALRTLEEFRDFWVGVPGQRGCKLDWDATFRNRLREVAGRQKQRQNGRLLPSPPVSGRTYPEFKFEPGELPSERRGGLRKLGNQ
jgi:Meiotically Up-regulated Gene 113 (MUG113) protein